MCWGLYHGAGVSAYLTWNRFKRRRRWRWADRGPLPVLGVAVTLSFVTGSYAFTSIHRVGTAWDGIRILAKLVGADLG